MGYVPGPKKDRCLLLDADPLDWRSPWVFFPLLFASVGIFATLAVVAVFILYNR